MKFGVREICDVVLRAKAAQKIGDKVFYKNEPVLYFDSLKTSSMEGAATTVYAQGGRGNARLIAWEGERTVTFTMEDALISPMGFSVLTGAGLIKANANNKMYVHRTEQTTSFKLKTGAGADATSVDNADYVAIELTKKPYIDTSKKGSEDYVYVMLLDDNGDVCSEPYIAVEEEVTQNEGKWIVKVYKTEVNETNNIHTSDDGWETPSTTQGGDPTPHLRANDLSKFKTASAVLVDYYTEETSGAFQIDITPDKFGGNFYLEASTLFRATNGVDMPAEFIIPNCKIQSNFTFTMASSGDPSTFTFTMDAFPDYTRWDKNKKVYAAIQVIEEGSTLTDFERLGTPHGGKDESGNAIATMADVTTQYNAKQKATLGD